MAYLSRNKVYARVEPTKDSRKIYIICQGAKTEVKYFNFFDKFSSNLQIITVPPQNNQSAPDKLIELCETKFFSGDSKYELLNIEHDEIWFVIDTDEWNLSGKIDSLKQYCISKVEKDFSVHVAQSNKSFEIWHYYHRFAVPPTEGEISQYLTFKDNLHSKIPGGFNPNRMPILINEAIENTKTNFNRCDHGQPVLHAAEVYLLAERIVELIGDDLNVARKQSGL